MFYHIKGRSARGAVHWIAENRGFPTQIRVRRPMLVVEVSDVVKAVTDGRSRVERLDEGEWLRRLLADIQKDVSEHPSPQAVERIRTRLLAALEKPARAAA